MKKDLWLRLNRYHFEHVVPTQLWDHVRAAFGGTNPSTRAFADKISRKLGWDCNFALRAIGEYKKFVFLGVVSDFGVTPSKIIDQVWHEHLLFTGAYRSFCAEILGRDFDHKPELVPVADETGIFQAQYRETLHLYQWEFGVDPPADIWSIPKFDPESVTGGNYKPRLKHQDGASAADGGDDTPLHVQCRSEGISSSGSEAGGDMGGDCHQCWAQWTRRPRERWRPWGRRGPWRGWRQFVQLRLGLFIQLRRRGLRKLAVATNERLHWSLECCTGIAV